MRKNTNKFNYKGAYNIIRKEDIRHFDLSLFAEQYEKVSVMVSEIIGYNLNLDICGNPYKEEYYPDKNKDYKIYNVISFLGGRGTGKTSAMVSYTEFLKNYEKNIENEMDESNKKYFLDTPPNNPVSFLTLDMIHATMLGKNEGILDVILANMWELYTKSLNVRGYHRDGLFEQKESIAKGFSALKKAYQDYLKSSTNDHASEIRQLSDLASSLNFRKKFQEFVQLFLKFFENKKNTFLVIMIDDIDMAKSDSFEILEQLHLFLRVPNVIIFITADIIRLQQICEHYYYKKYVDGELANTNNAELDLFIRNKQDFSNDFLEKIIALDMRINMPDFYVVNPPLAEEKKDEELKLKNKILQILFDNNLEFDGKAHEHHFLEGFTLRENTALLHELDRGCKLKTDESGGINNWLMQRIKEQLANRIEDSYLRKNIKELFHIDDRYLNEYFMQLIYNKLEYLEDKANYRREFRLYNCRISEILYGCNILEQWNYRHRDLVNVIIAYYTARVAQAGKKPYSNVEYMFKDALWGIWTNNMLKGMREQILNYGVQTVASGLNLKEFGIRILVSVEEINTDLLKDLNSKEINIETDKIAEFIVNLIENNKEQIYAYQVLLAFLDIKGNKPGVNSNLIISSEIKDSHTVEMTVKKDAVQEDSKKPDNNFENKSSQNEKKEMPTSFSLWLQYNFEHGALDFNFDYPLMNISSLKEFCCDFKENLYDLILEGLLKSIDNIFINKGEPDGDTRKVIINKDVVKQECKKAFGQHHPDIFLEDAISVWEEEYPGKFPFPYQNIEMVYAIGKKLENDNIIFNKGKFYTGLRKIYEVICKELDERDEFYDTKDNNTGYCSPFKEYPVIKYFLENKSSDTVQGMLEPLVKPVSKLISPVQID